MKSSPKIILSDEFGDGVTYTSASQHYTDVMSVHTQQHDVATTFVMIVHLHQYH